MLQSFFYKTVILKLSRSNIITVTEFNNIPLQPLMFQSVCTGFAHVFLIPTLRALIVMNILGMIRKVVCYLTLYCTLRAD